MSAVQSTESLAAKRGAFHEIPVIDFAGAFCENRTEREKVAKETYDACVRVGFFYIRNHGVSELVMKNVFSAAKQFFALPLADKMSIDINKSPHFRGYTKLMVRFRSRGLCSGSG
jgi:isopenicillin N synthase-like dioxygenase